VEHLAADADSQVRFQVALSLGEWDDDRILPSLASIALAGAGDRWTRLAGARAGPKRGGALIVLLLAPGPLVARATPGTLQLVQELAALVGARREPAEVADVLEALLAIQTGEAAQWQMAGLNGLADGMDRRGTQLGAFLKTLPESKRSV